MDSNTIFTIGPSIAGSPMKFDKSEISILNYIEGWLPTFMAWNVQELAIKCRLFASDTTTAVDMLILHGLLENTDGDAQFGRRVQVTADGALWMREHAETIRSINYMNDTELFESAEIAEA